MLRSSTYNKTDQRIRKGFSQTSGNRGGIIMDYTKSDLDFETAIDYILKSSNTRIREKTDIIVKKGQKSEYTDFMTKNKHLTPGHTSQDKMLIVKLSFRENCNTLLHKSQEKIKNFFKKGKNDMEQGTIQGENQTQLFSFCLFITFMREKSSRSFSSRASDIVFICSVRAGI